MNITVNESIWIDATPELVWDFTQDWHRRPDWDDTILDATAIAISPRVVRFRARGGLSAVVRYKLDERPNQTSLVMSDVKSWLICGGGGSWRYLPERGGTEFVQTNTLTIDNVALAAIFAPLVRWQLRRGTRRALGKAKRLIEQRGV